jgi:hypothetical protein
MAAYFDAFLYLANWRTRHLMFRVPRAALDTEYAGQYCYTDAASLIETDDHLIISLYADRDPDDSWDETTGELGGMAAARSELLGGDHRLLYLAWLMGIHWDQADDEDTEPPVPVGLEDLNGALRAVADFLEIDKDLIAVAAEASPPLKEEPAAGLADWITALPAAEMDKLLTMVADGEGPQVQALLLRRFRGRAPDQNEPAQFKNGNRIQLLICGFGVQIPGSAPAMTWGFTTLGLLLAPCSRHRSPSAPPAISASASPTPANSPTRPTPVQPARPIGANSPPNDEACVRSASSRKTLAASGSARRGV